MGTFLPSLGAAIAIGLAGYFLVRRQRSSRLHGPQVPRQNSTFTARDMGWSLSGQVVMITGAAQGLGLTCARAAATAGASGLILLDRDVEKGRSAQRELQTLGCACLFVECDLCVPAQITSAVQAADAHFHRIDGLINAAGDTRRSTLDETTVELWDALIAVNLRAPFLLMQAVSRVMIREGRGGSIVNVASVQAHGGLTFCMAYATSKGGLLTLTRNVAAELAKHAIKVNAINMGWTPTDNEHELQVSLGQGEDWLDAADQASILGRLCRTADVARAILFLLAGAHSTGSVLELHPEHIPGMLSAGIGKAR